MTSATLDVSQSNCTRNLYWNYPQIKFFTTSFPHLFQDLPIEGAEKRYDENEAYAKTKISNLMRMALVYKYGGFYADLDVVILKSLAGIKNFMTLERDLNRLES